ncbi:MAG: glycosyltransferase family 4 protein, partial [Prevotella sp.]|nr:glycosyltransferase family 4 protein [Prevotella sp.]
MSKKLFIVVNVDWFFLSHRLSVALRAQKAGWNVTIITADTGKLKEIESYGLKTTNLPMSRSGMNIKEELKTLQFLTELYKIEKPDIVHHVGMKTILWGTLAAKFAKVNGVVNAISGLGGFFSEDNKGILSKVLLKVLKYSHNKKGLLCIFQNNEDRDLYVENGIINISQARHIKGSGIDLFDFNYTPEPSEGKIKIILTARMIVEKGIFILTEAAEILRAKYGGKAEFLLVGGIDDHPGAITKEQLDTSCDGNYIKWLGYRTDIRDLLMKSHIVAFPSYYMEGLPKSLIEACAIGRPIITCDSVGCRETVVDGVNGYLIP